MISSSLEYARLLIEHRRFKEAEEALRQEIANDPQNGMAYAFLALAVLGQEQPERALPRARQAVGLAPDQPYCHYVLAVCLKHLEQYDEALAVMSEAIRLDPSEAQFYATLGSIFLARQDWKAALEAAEMGRKLDPTHTGCTNVQAIALVKLGRRSEAQESLGGALGRDPLDATTHANQGWALLHAGKHEEAMQHFKEALRLNPMLDWARSGIIESLRARNPIYRVVLKYFLWMSRLGPQARWGVVIGAYLLYRVTYSFTQSNPAYQGLALPLMGIYLGLVVLSWAAQPLTDLLVRLDRYGRLALTEKQIAASNWVGLCLAVSLGLAAGGLGLGSTPLLAGAAGAFAMVLPVSGVFQVRPGTPRRILGLYAVGLAGLGATGLALALRGDPAAGSLGTFFILGWAGFTWIGNMVGSLR